MDGLSNPRDLCMEAMAHVRVQDVARRSPTAPAVADGTCALTYGALDAVSDSLAHRLRALGVRPLTALLDGTMTRDEAAEASKTETRRYAKRQMTWLRRNMMAWKWTSAQQMESLAANFDEFDKART